MDLKKPWIFLPVWATVWLVSIVAGNAQTKLEALDFHKEASQVELWQSIQTMEASGSLYLNGEKELEGIFHFKRDHKWRFISEDKRTVYAFDDHLAWSKLAGEELPSAITDKDLARLFSSLFHFTSPLVAATPEKISFHGKVNVDKQSCFWFTIANGNVTHELFVQESSGRIYRHLIKSAAVTQNFEINLTYKTYRVFSGIAIPTVINARLGKHELEYVLDEILLGQGIPNSLFSLPSGL